MEDKRIQLLVGLNTIDPEEAEAFAQLLMQNLRDIDGVGSVLPRPVSQLPDGAKAAGGWDFGAIALAVLEASGFQALLATLTTWFTFNKSRSVKIQLGEHSLEVANLSAEKQDELIEWFQNQTSMRLTS